MSPHALTQDRRPRLAARPWSRNGLLQLGWPHFWLLAGILGGMLGLVALVFFVSLSTR
jgi:hypothetical protein